MIPKYICDLCVNGPYEDNKCGKNTYYIPIDFCEQCEIRGVQLDIDVQRKCLIDLNGREIFFSEVEKKSLEFEIFLLKSRSPYI